MSQETLPDSAGQRALPPLTLDPEMHLARRGERFFRLSRQEFILCHFLAQNRGHTVPVEDICKTLWVEHSLEDARVLLKIYVSRVRRKIEPDQRHPVYLLNTRGIGYRLDCEPRVVVEADSQIVG